MRIFSLNSNYFIDGDVINLDKNLIIYPELKYSIYLKKDCECKKILGGLGGQWTCKICEKTGLVNYEIELNNNLLEKLPLIEKEITKRIKNLKINYKKSVIDINFYNSKEIIKFLQNFIISKETSIDTGLFLDLLNLKKIYKNNHEINYYIKKSLDLIDLDVVFLIQIYTEIIKLFKKKESISLDIFFYEFFDKYFYLIEKLKINYPISKEYFTKVNSFYFGGRTSSLIDIYPRDREYRSGIYSIKNLHYDFNFSKAAIKRIKDLGLYNYSSTFNSLILQIRDEIKEECGIKTKNKNLINENLLYNNLKKILGNTQIYRNVRMLELRNLELDIYFEINKKKIGIEYQGQQHYQPVNFFGGKKSFIRTQKNDKIKSFLCKKNNILLIEFPYFLKNNVENLRQKLLDNGVVINKKNDFELTNSLKFRKINEPTNYLRL